MQYNIDDNPTRRQLVMLLKKSEYMTVTEMSEVMGITPMAVRQHLMSLERKGLVRFEPKKYGIGRPMFVYRLTEKAKSIFPNAYGIFLLDVLRTLEEIDGREKVEELFRRRKQKMFEVKHRALLGMEDFTEKVAVFTELLDRDGFLVELEEGDGEFHIKQYNCLLTDVANKYPEACTYEMELYKELLGECVARTHCQREGAPFCSYNIPIPQDA